DRAMTAAAAAIANPLLDDVSMRGARGLLISITGGPDLTLYEVDEAATRIREEVDSEANIILGATFDEGLEGVIRVSVVATGIDHEIGVDAGEVTATEQRIAEVAERLRAEARARAAQAAAQRSLVQPAKPSETLQSAPLKAPAPQTETQPAGLSIARSVTSAEAESAAPAPNTESGAVTQGAATTQDAPPAHAGEQPDPARLERPAMPSVHDLGGEPVVAEAPRPSPVAAVEAALSAVPEASTVGDAPQQQAPAPYPPAPAHTAPMTAHDEPFMPPQPERVLRTPRMPRVDELPMPAQNQIRAHQESDSRRPSLLQRLATVGFGRREDHAAETHEPTTASQPASPPVRRPAMPRAAEAPAPQMPQAQDAALLHAPSAQPRAQGMSPAHAEFAKRSQPAPAPQGYRPAQGQLDPHGRAPAPSRSLDDDQLEIPAFLRRQAN
ncbi:MAG: hypothetical protein ACXIVE_16850, partial [Salinarimonas sp.]